MRKTISKGIALVLVALMALMIFAGCSKKVDSKYVGTWNAEKYEYSGIELSTEEVGEAVMEIKSNGKLTITFDGEEGTSKWEETDNGLVIKDSDGELEVVEQDDYLVIEQDDDYMYFKKQ